VGSPLARKGSAVRASLGLAATFAIFVVLAVPALWIGARVWPRGRGFDELIYVVFALMVITVGTLVVLPLVTYTFGRLLDRGHRGPPAYAAVGAVLGALPGFFLIADLLQFGVMSLLFGALGGVAGALGRVVFERGLRSREWRIAIWIAFAFTVPGPLFAGFLLILQA